MNVIIIIEQDQTTIRLEPTSDIDRLVVRDMGQITAHRSGGAIILTKGLEPVLREVK